MSYAPRPDIQKAARNTEGYVEVIVDASRVERVISELGEKFDLTPVTDLENLSRVNFENLAAKYEQLVKSSNHLGEIYGKMFPLLTQTVDKIQGLESQLAKINDDNNLWGSVSKSLKPVQLIGIGKSPDGHDMALDVNDPEAKPYLAAAKKKKQKDKQT